MHISTFLSTEAPVAGHRFAYGTLEEDYQGNEIVAKVVFFNDSDQIAGLCTVNISQGEMPSSGDILVAYTSRAFSLLDNQQIVAELKGALTSEARHRAKSVTVGRLSELVGELLIWREKGALPADSNFHYLASLCTEFAMPGDEYQEAERLVVLQALRHARDA